MPGPAPGPSATAPNWSDSFPPTIPPGASQPWLDGEHGAFLSIPEGYVAIGGPNGQLVAISAAAFCALAAQQNAQFGEAVEPPALRKPPPTMRGTRRKTKPPPKKKAR